MGALDTAVRQGKALYVGISSYSAARTKEASAILRRMGTPLLIHQPSYSMLNRWIEPDLLDVLGKEGVGCITFSPLAQGLLTDRYLNGIPAGSRASHAGSFSQEMLTDETLAKVRARRTSVLDLISGRYTALSKVLSGVDKQKIDAHFTALRDIESRIGVIDTGVVSGVCTKPTPTGWCRSA